MWRKFCRWLAVLFLWGSLVSPACAQEEPAPNSENDPPVKEYTVAALTAALVLVIVCKPSQARD